MACRTKNLPFLSNLGLRVLSLCLLALGLIPLGQAQVQNISLNLGVNRIKVAGALPVAGLNYKILLPTGASEVVFSIENGTGGGAVTYTATFAEDSIDPIGASPAMTCVRWDWNKQVSSNSSGSFPSVLNNGVVQRYVCPVSSSNRILFTIFATSAGTDSTSIYAIVHQGHSSLLPVQSPSGNTFTHISTATNTQVKTGAGIFHSLTINTTAAGTITVFDNTSCAGSTIAIIAASAAAQTYTYDVQFTTGLCVTTGAASDVTISAR